MFFSPKHEKTAFANFTVYQRDVLGWGDLKERIFLKNVISFDPPKVLLSILEFVLVKSIFIYTQTELIININLCLKYKIKGLRRKRNFTIVGSFIELTE